MITTAEDRLLRELAKELEVHVETIRRWANVGLTSNAGKNVKLDTVRLPHGKGSSMDRYRDFVERLND